jgi:hypothetical protein
VKVSGYDGVARDLDLTETALREWVKHPIQSHQRPDRVGRS